MLNDQNTDLGAVQLATFIEWITSALDLDADQDRIAGTKAKLDREADQAPGVYLKTRLGLSESEANVVWLLAAVAMDSCVRERVGQIDPTPNGDPTLGGVRRLVYGATLSRTALAELSERGLLRKLGIIERTDSVGPNTHESRWTWALSQRVLAMLHGDEQVAATLDGIAMRSSAVLELEHVAVTADAVSEMTRAMRHRDANHVVNVVGKRGLGRRTLVMSVASQLGIELLTVECSRLAKDIATFRSQLRAIAIECKLAGLVPALLDVDVLAANGSVSNDDQRLGVLAATLLPLIDGPVIMTSISKAKMDVDRPTIVVEMKAPSTQQRTHLWHRALGEGTLEDAELLSDAYPMVPALIVRAGEAARARANGGAVRPDDVFSGISAVLDDELSQYAKRIMVTQDWKDIVLPGDSTNQVLELIARIRERKKVIEAWGYGAKVGNKGLGVSALFSGVPGTGKSMLAGVIAKELNLELYQVDMSKIASKWIGETEKNLAALFDAAEASCAVLLFDECDSLFGKRTSVATSNDRHANLETNYLLQRLESFTGICVLTSNHENNIDPAFFRRLTLHLRFQLPEVDERARLWEAMLPASAPVGSDVDIVDLARRYEMSGGYIRNATLRAAFLAASEQSPICQRHLIHAALGEYEAMGKISFDGGMAVDAGTLSSARRVSSLL